MHTLKGQMAPHESDVMSFKDCLNTMAARPCYVLWNGGHKWLIIFIGVT